MSSHHGKLWLHPDFVTEEAREEPLVCELVHRGEHLLGSTYKRETARQQRQSALLGVVSVGEESTLSSMLSVIDCMFSVIDSPTS